MKTDPEPAIVALQMEVAACGPGVEAEKSTVAYFPTSGMVENAILRMTGVTRTLENELEDRIGRRVPLESAVVARAVQHAATLIDFYGVDDGGKSPMQRARGQGRP